METVHRNLFRVDTAEVPHVAAAILFGIRIQQFRIEPGVGHADAVVAAWNGSIIAHDDRFLAAIAVGTNPGKDAVLPVVGLNPLEISGGQ